MRYSNFKNALKSYIKNNYKEYVLVSLLFIIGIFVGVMIINNSKDQQTSEITSFINGFITKYKEIENINKTALIIESIRKNLIFAIVLWLAGTTVIGMPIVLIIILLRGTILGFTISSISVTLGPLKGSLFCLISIVLHNIIFIPAILSIGVSSIKLYKSIIRDKRKENIKLEILRHTAISALMILLLIISSIIENSISANILKLVIKYF